MRKLFVLYSQIGQLGNRLQTASYFLAAVLEDGGISRLCCFDGYEADLNRRKKAPLVGTIERKAIKFLARRPTLQKLLKVAVLQGSEQSPLILTSSDTQKQIDGNRVIVVTGYYIYSHPNVLLKHSERIIKKLNLRASSQDSAYVHKILGDRSATFVGIHIRQGDYMTYRNGEFFFPVEQYERIARSITDNHPSAKIRFIVCSDAEIKDSSFAGLDWERGPGSILGDIYALSLCDYVMGPFSTFNRWSAFWGNKPRLELSRDLESASLSDFRPQLDLTYPEEWKDELGGESTSLACRA